MGSIGTPLQRSARATAWMRDAACLGQTALFFASHAERPGARKLREAGARAVCMACPVVEPCRDRARRWGEYGFWGGETEEERSAAGFPVAPPGRLNERTGILRRAASMRPTG